MDSPTNPTRAALNAAGEERPRFLLDFPEDPQLEPLIELFEEGNFYELRKRVKALEQEGPPVAIRAAALELLERTRPDPSMIWLLLLCLGLFAFIVGWTYLR